MPAAGTVSPESARIDISKLIDEFKIDFVKSTVAQIRPQDKKVIMEDSTLSYDYLVVGLGGEPETFGIPGLKEHALTIRSLNSVRYIREHIEFQFAKYKQEPHRTDYLTFVVGGAGFTGIEFLGELVNRLPKLCKEFDVDPSLVKIINVEAAPTVLPGFDEEMVEYASQLLTGKGVIFKLNAPIKECREDGVILVSGEVIKAGTVVWTGGVRGNRLLEDAGFETKRGRVVVGEHLRTKEYENIYVLGDCSIVLDEEGRPFPTTAQIAIQQAEICSHNLIATIRNTPLKPFSFTSKGTVASLGRGEAIGVVGKRKVKGFSAVMIKKAIDIKYLYTIGGIPLVVKKGF
jgi:NADH dehydrogenase